MIEGLREMMGKRRVGRWEEGKEVEVAVSRVLQRNALSSGCVTKSKAERPNSNRTIKGDITMDGELTNAERMTISHNSHRVTPAN